MMNGFIKGDQVVNDFKTYFSRCYRTFYDEDCDIDTDCIDQMLKQMFEKLNLNKDGKYEVIVSDAPILPYKDPHAVTGFDESNVTTYDMTFDWVSMQYQLAYAVTYRSEDDRVQEINIDKLAKLTCIEKSTDKEIYRKYTAINDETDSKPLAHSISNSDLSILAYRSTEIKLLKETVDPPDECIIIKVLYSPEYVDRDHMGRYSITLEHALRFIREAKELEDSINSVMDMLKPSENTGGGDKAKVIKLNRLPKPRDLKEIIGKIIGVPTDMIGLRKDIPEEVEKRNERLARISLTEALHNYMSKCQFAPNTKLGRICKGPKKHPCCKLCVANPIHLNGAYNELAEYLEINAPKKIDTENGYRKFQIEKAREWLSSEANSSHVTYLRSGIMMSKELMSKLMLSTKLRYRYIGKNGETYTGVAHKKILTKGIALADKKGDIVPILDRDILVKSYRDPNTMVKWNAYPEGTFDDIACGVVPICITHYALNENSKIVKGSMTNTIVIAHVNLCHIED